MCQIMFISSKHLSNKFHVWVPIKTEYMLQNFAEMQLVGGYKGTPTTKSWADAYQGKSWQDAWWRRTRRSGGVLHEQGAEPNTISSLFTGLHLVGNWQTWHIQQHYFRKELCLPCWKMSTKYSRLFNLNYTAPHNSKLMLRKRRKYEKPVLRWRQAHENRPSLPSAAYKNVLLPRNLK